MVLKLTSYLLASALPVVPACLSRWISAHCCSVSLGLRLNLTSERRVRDEALTAMIYGKRVNNGFLYQGVLWGFNAKLDTLKTVYVV